MFFFSVLNFRIQIYLLISLTCLSLKSRSFYFHFAFFPRVCGGQMFWYSFCSTDQSSRGRRSCLGWFQSLPSSPPPGVCTSALSWSFQSQLWPFVSPTTSSSSNCVRRGRHNSRGASNRLTNDVINSFVLTREPLGTISNIADLKSLKHQNSSTNYTFHIFKTRSRHFNSCSIFSLTCLTLILLFRQNGNWTSFLVFYLNWTFSFP